MSIPDGSVHGWFGLSYANYLVLPRTQLQSMPLEWQDRFFAALRELADQLGHHEAAIAYDVRALARLPQLITESKCTECDGEGWLELEEGIDDRCDGCGGTGYTEDPEQRYETSDEVGFVTDPTPHYNRGRTRLELRGPITVEAIDNRCFNCGGSGIRCCEYGRDS